MSRKFEEELGIPLTIAASGRGVDLRRLSPRERSRYRALEAFPRRESWLKGRSALKRLLQRFGERDDTAEVCFPHPRFSLTHSGRYAVAIGTDADRLEGIGIDLEVGRSPHPESARFFLTPEEQDWLYDQNESDRPSHLLRLWTVKESLFKADPKNDRTGLPDYRIKDPGARRGIASVRHGRELGMRYASSPCGEGWISIAIYPRRDDHAGRK
ncbi:MAG TPA: 4'-phosphopantetheinyl transferase superfamily protein [Candidatus Manganitrophaceae bacterium]|nr:4'-phosphopantetheinyl transferase superfamily protein [Candidatus Manganitrophaceae bacterium]